MAGELTNTTLEIWYDGQWNDHTDRLYNRDPVTIQRGIQNEGGRADPGHASVTINNRDGVFSPRNPRSPLYGLIGRNTPVRISAGLAGNPQSVRFVGEVVQWPQRWDRSGNDVHVPIQAAGILRRLGVPSSPLRDAPRRAIARIPDVAGYWPMQDGEQARVAAVVAGGSGPLRLVEHTFTGVGVQTEDFGEFGQGDLAPWLDPVMLFGAERLGRMAAAIRGRATGRIAMEFAHRYSGLQDGANEPVLQVSLSYAPFGSRFTLNRTGPTFGGAVLSHAELDADGSSSVTFPIGSGDDPFSYQVGLDQGLHVFRLELENGTTGIDWAYYIDGNFQDSGTVSGVEPMQQPTEVRVSWLTTNAVGQQHVGHLLVLDDWVVADRDAARDALLGHAGEAAGRRVERLCAEEGVPLATVGDLDATMPMGPQRPGELLDLLDECADAEAAGAPAPILTETRDALSLTWTCRSELYLTD